MLNLGLKKTEDEKMFAVIETGGKQYKIQEGDVLQVEKLGLEKGQKVTFDHVLLIDDEKDTFIGTPFLENALVRGEVIENFKDEKVIVFKKKRRKQYKKKIGHRQELTRVKIEEIFMLSGDEMRNQVDIKINVRGGGFVGQAEAARTAIARGLISYFEDEGFKEMLIQYDRTIVSGDPRRTEPKHFGGPSSRSRFQKSYR